MKGYHVFLAISACLAVLLTYTSSKRLVIILIFFWLVRLFFLKNKRLLYLSLAVLLVFSWRACSLDQNNQSRLEEDTTEFYLSVKRDSVKIDGDRLQFEARVENEGENESVMVFYQLKDEKEKNAYLEAGITPYVYVSGKLKEPGGRRNFHQFDYQEYLRRQHIHWLLEAGQLQHSDQDYERLLDQVRDWRYQIIHLIDRKFTGELGIYIKMLLFSDRRNLSDQVLLEFQNIGIIHILSISGMHISFYIHLIRMLFLRLGFTRERIPLLMIGVLTLYGFLADWGTSVFRAVFQSHFKSLRSLFNLPLTSPDIWALTCLTALLINPYAIFSLGFQLSYSLSLLLILLARTPQFNRLSPWRQSLFLNVFINLVSLPFILYHNFEFPWLSLAANLLIIPIFSRLILPACLTGFFLGGLFPSSLLFTFYQAVFNQGVRGLESFIHLLNSFPSLTFVTGRLSTPALFLLVFAIYGVFWIFESQKDRRGKLLSYFLVSLVMAGAVTSEHWLPTTTLVMLDVGQGDSLLIKGPFWQKSILIDTGGIFSYPQEEWQRRERPYQLTDRVLIPVMKSYGLSQVDQLILTHSDHDHSGELARLINQFQVEEVVMTSLTLGDESIQKQLLKLDKKFPRLEVLDPDQIPYSLSPRLKIIWPGESITDDANNTSLVIYGKVGKEWWIFTGDIEKEIEKKLIETYPRLPVDNLKVGHHGSQTSTSSEFIDHLAPSRALISAGEKNRYNHPHPEITARLEAEGIEVFRTDQEGAVAFTYFFAQEDAVIETVHSKEEIK